MQSTNFHDDDGTNWGTIMNKIIATGLVLGLVIAAGATPVLANNYTNGGVTGDEIAADLRAMGQTATVGKDSSGDPKIDAAFKVDKTSIDYQIYFYGCKTGRCTAIQYHVAFDGDIKKVADWNKSYRFARAYATDATTIHLEYDVDLEKGANTDAVQNSAERFKAVMVQGVTFLSGDK